MSRTIPIIGIPGWRTGDNSFGITLPYLEFFNQYGMVKIITLTKDVDTSLDLLVVPGGPDVNPLRYGAEPAFNTSKSDPIREYFDTVILPLYVQHGTPVFGICRGIQSIAVLFGAKLVQDIYKHNSNDSLDRGKVVHQLKLIDTAFTREFLRINKSRELGVNSIHHQCVSAKEFPECLEVLAVYKNKNECEMSAIEVIRHKTLPIIAVQYHPEEMGYEVFSDFMIETLISKSKNYA